MKTPIVLLFALAMGLAACGCKRPSVAPAALPEDQLVGLAEKHARGCSACKPALERSPEIFRHHRIKERTRDYVLVEFFDAPFPDAVLIRVKLRPSGSFISAKGWVDRGCVLRVPVDR